MGKMRYMSVARERPPVERIVRPFQDFVDKQSSGGIVLIAATAIALANAGLPLGGNILGALAEPVALGILFGLVFGKQIGVMLFSWLAVRSGLAELPEGIGWRHVYGVGWLAGIGFTMSLFISDLAFSDGALVDTAKLGILAASLISGVVGWTLLRRATALSRPG